MLAGKERKRQGRMAEENEKIGIQGGWLKKRQGMEMDGNE